MATIGEILAAKGKKPPVIDDTMDLTPETVAPPAPPDPTDIPDAPAKVPDSSPVPVPQTAQQGPSAQDLGNQDVADLRAAQDEADRRANLKQDMQQVVAYFSQGAQDPNKLDLTQANALRSKPLEMYKARQEARKNAAEQALQAAHARYFGAETENIPKKEAREQAKSRADIAARQTELTREQQKLDSDIEQKKAELAEHIRNNDQISADKAKAEIAAMQRVRVEQAGANARATPYRAVPNPYGLEPTIVNEHTGQPISDQDGGAKKPLDKAMIPAYEQVQAKKMGVDKDLNTLDTASRDTDDAISTLQNTKGWQPSRAEQVVGGVNPAAGAAVSRAANMFRSPEAIEARNKVRRLFVENLKAMGGVRAAASPADQKLLGDVMGDINSPPDQLMSALKVQQKILNERRAAIRAKLPIYATGRAQQPGTESGSQQGGGGGDYLHPDKAKQLGLE